MRFMKKERTTLTEDLCGEKNWEREIAETQRLLGVYLCHT